jgi:hypothetical protein
VADEAADLDLTVSQARVLGSLLEKQFTTPAAYPTTLNALVGACNQISSRDPILHLDPTQVETAALALKSKGLLRVVHPGSGERSTRYRQVADELLGLGPAERAVLCLLLLRGPQTVAELRARSERMHNFADAGSLEDVLHALASRGGPLVARLERVPGQKEGRWAQLLEAHSALPQFTAATSAGAVERHVSAGPASAPATAPGPSLKERVEALEARLESLIEALGDLVQLDD